MPSQTVPSQTVPSLIRARVAGERDDGHTLALAVEGGGMRGIVSGGMLLALRDLGLLEAFDAFYGTSSGSLNLAYTLGGTSWEGVTVYYDHLTNGFVRRHQRWNPAKSLLDMDYAFDEVMTHTVPINWEAVSQIDRPLWASVTNVDEARRELVDARHLGEDAMAYMKAGSWMPWLAGKPPVIHGTRYLDGGLLCPDPVYAAVDDGATHVLVLNSFPQGNWPALPASRPVLRRALNGLQHGLGDAYVASRQRWDADQKRTRFDADETHGHSLVRRLAVPAGAHHVSQFTHGRGALFDGARAGYQAVTDLFVDDGRRPYFSVTLR